MGEISYFAIITIIKFRIKEFFFEYNYTILAPLINTILFVIIFKTIENNYFIIIEDRSFIEFLVPGLILMMVAQESYDNVSVTIINMKQIGSFDNYLMAPISRVEIFISLIISSIIIGLFLGFIIYFILSFFINFEKIEIFFSIYYLILAIIFFTSLGSITGFLSYTWDTQSTVSNFFVMPINLLSGTFFSINSLPESFKFLFYYNPYYYLVSNFRNSFYYDYVYDLHINLSIIFFVFIFLIFSCFIFFIGFKVIK